MNTQGNVIDFLSSGPTFGPGVTTVERIETHGALVFLAGAHVYKIKRAVKFSYMDFSTLDLRRLACQREIEVNQPHAPDIYLGLVAITRTVDGGLELGGDGEPVEWAVHMRRFPADALLSQVVERGAFGAVLARDTADAVFDYHGRVDICASVAPAERLAEIITELTGAMNVASMGFQTTDVNAFDAGCRHHLQTVAPILAERARQGFVRRCHGDLHLANIVMWNYRPTPFDAIEFDEKIAIIDTLYDLAFLLMDLDERGHSAAANLLLNRYLWRSRHMLDFEGLAALPLFLALRAGIRAMVLAQRVGQQPSSGADDGARHARGYLRAALGYLQPEPPRLIAVGGLSGTGKSTLAAALAPLIGAAPGAVHLRSDLERKSMFGVADTARLGAECYSQQASDRVYGLLSTKARAALSAGRSVIVDAVYLRPDERAAIEGMASSLARPFHGLWLTAPPASLIHRVAARTGDASDATVDVVRSQLGIEHSAGAWTVIDAGGSADDTRDAARRALQLA